MREFRYIILLVSALLFFSASFANDCATANNIVSQESFDEAEVSGSFVGAGFSGDPQCAGPGLRDDVWYSFTAIATDHGIRAQGAGDLNLAVEVYDACGGTQIACQNNSGVGGAENVLLPNLTVGNTYFYRVYHAGAAPAVADAFITAVIHVPFVELRPSDCGTLNFTTNDVIRATNPSNTENFTNYQFRFVEQQAPFNTYIITSPNGTNPNFLLQWFPQIEYGRTYEVSVRVRAILPTYGDFGNTCIIGLQNNVLNTFLENQYSGGFFDFCDVVGARKVALATQYRWTFLDFTSNPPVQTEVLGLADSRLLNLYRVPELQLGTTYIVSVFATVAGEESSTGPLRFLNMNNAVPNTGLNSDIYPCGQTYPISTFLQAREICEAESYTWRFTNTSSPQAPIFYTRDDGSRFVDLDFVTGLNVGDSYDVEVLAAQGGLIGDYSTICNITIGPSENPNLLVMQSGDSEIIADPQGEINYSAFAEMKPRWEVDMQRISNSADIYNVTLSSEDNSDRAFVEVYDLNGRLIDLTSPVLMVGSTVKVDLTGLPKGVYLLRIFNETQQETKKVTTF
jgi:hypothetical protein